MESHGIHFGTNVIYTVNMYDKTLIQSYADDTTISLIGLQLLDLEIKAFIKLNIAC